MKILIAIFSVIMSTCQAQNTESPYEAELKTEVKDGQHYITGYFSNHSTKSLELQYTLKSKKEGKSGTSNNSQSGQFKIDPDVKASLSTVSMNIQKGDKFEFLLTISKKNGKEIARAIYSNSTENE